MATSCEIHSSWKFCLHLRCCNRDIFAHFCLLSCKIALSSSDSRNFFPCSNFLIQFSEYLATLIDGKIKKKLIAPFLNYSNFLRGLFFLCRTLYINEYFLVLRFSWHEAEWPECRRQHGISDDTERLLSWKFAAIATSDISTRSSTWSVQMHHPRRRRPRRHPHRRRPCRCPSSSPLIFVLVVVVVVILVVVPRRCPRRRRPRRCPSSSSSLSTSSSSSSLSLSLVIALVIVPRRRPRRCFLSSSFSSSPPPHHHHHHHDHQHCCWLSPRACIVPKAANSLQSAQFWAISSASVSVRLWDYRSFCTVLSHVICANFCIGNTALEPLRHVILIKLLTKDLAVALTFAATKQMVINFSSYTLLLGTRKNMVRCSLHVMRTRNWHQLSAMHEIFLV